MERLVRRVLVVDLVDNTPLAKNANVAAARAGWKLLSFSNVVYARDDLDERIAGVILSSESAIQKKDATKPKAAMIAERVATPFAARSVAEKARDIGIPFVVVGTSDEIPNDFIFGEDDRFVDRELGDRMVTTILRTWIQSLKPRLVDE